MTETTESSPWVLLGEVEYAEAKRLQAALMDRGVEIRLSSDPETCASGSCKPKLQLRAPASAIEKVKAFFEEERARAMAGLEPNQGLVDEVFDPSRETARCPACGTEFSTQLKECPDCGLCFG